MKAKHHIPELVFAGCDLAVIRALESRVALNRRDRGSVRIHRLPFTGGAVTERIQHLTDVLSHLLRPDGLCLSQWRSDGHPHRDATGRDAVAAARLIRTLVLGLMMSVRRRYWRPFKTFIEAEL